MGNSYTVEDVLQFLDVGLPEEEESEDDFDGYVDEDKEEDDELPEEDDVPGEEDNASTGEEGDMFGEKDDYLEEMEQDGIDIV